MGYSFGQILLGWILLWLDTPWLDTFNMVSPQGCISPQANYPLRQHISSGTIFVLVTNLLQHVVFPQLQSFQAVSIPLDWLLLITVGSWRMSSSSPCESWRTTCFFLFPSLFSEPRSRQFLILGQAGWSTPVGGQH